MKRCNRCKVEKELIFFHKNRSSCDGYNSICKVCKNLKNKQYKSKNVDIIKLQNKVWYQENKERKRDYYKMYYRDNKYRYHLAYMRRMQTIRVASLSGFDKDIREIYKNRPSGCHVDHIVPLQGKGVCGLHVPWNLQYLSASDNLSKGNKYEGVIRCLY